MDKSKIAVIGGGSWATAIAKILCNNVDVVNWWIRSTETANHIKKYRHNPNYLSSVEFEAGKLFVSTDLKDIIARSEVIILAVPSAFLKEALKTVTSNDL